MSNVARSPNELKRGLAIGDGWHLALPPDTDIAVANSIAKDVYGWEETTIEHTGGALLVRPKEDDDETI